MQVTPDAVGVRPLRLPQPRPPIDQPTSRCPSAAPATAHIYARNKQVVLGTTWTPSRDVAARGALRLVTDRRPARTRRHSAATARSTRSAWPACPTDAAHRRRPADAGHHRLLRPRPPGDQSAVAVSRRSTTRRSTTPGEPARTRSRAGYEFQHIDTEVQDVNPLYGRDTYNGQFTRPAGVGGEQHLQPRRLHARPARRSTRSATCWSPTCAGTCTSPTCRTTGASGDRADAESRPALRVRDAAVGGRQHPVELRPGDQHDDPGQGRIDQRPRADQSRIATTSGRASASPTP